MIQKILTKIVGSKNEREIKRLQLYVDQTNQLEPGIAKLSDEQLRAKTDQFILVKFVRFDLVNFFHFTTKSLGYFFSDFRSVVGFGCVDN